MKSISRLGCLLLAVVVLTISGVRDVEAEEVRRPVRVEVPQELPPHPRLFLNPTEIEKLKAWIDREPWLRAYVDNFIGETRKKISAVPLPKQKLEGSENRAISTQANEFALAYVLTDENVFAAAAAKILKAYVPLYMNYPVTNTKGRAMPSTLNEARWAGEYACAYDLIYNSGELTTEDKTAIEQQVLKPCGEVMRICNHRYRSNWRARAFAGVGMVGFCINDRELIDEALHGYRDASGKLLRDGFVQQVSYSIMADGIFYERSFGYQAFTADSYFLLMEAARHSGVDLWNLEVPSHPLDAGADVERVFGQSGPKTIKPIFDSLFYRTFSDGMVSVVANASANQFKSRRYYDAVWRAYRDPKYALAARIPADTERPWAKAELSDQVRLRTPTDLMFLEPDLPAGSFNLSKDTQIGHTGRHENGCTLLPNGGYAVLRQSAKPGAVGVSMTFGRWGSGHSHPDKLSIVVSDGKRKAVREVKYFGYGTEKYLTWDRQTIAHNTVTVDEKSQAPQSNANNPWAIPAPGEMVRGRPLMFHPGERMKVFRAECTDAYEGVRLERTLVVVDSMIVDFYRCLSDEPHTYDYSMQIDGEFPSDTSAEAGPLSDAYGYRHITDLRHTKTPATLSFSPGGNLALLNEGKATTGVGVVGKKGERRSVLVVRQKGTNVDFVTVMNFGKQPVAAERVRNAPTGEQAVRLPGGLVVTNSAAGVTLSGKDGGEVERADLPEKN